MVTEYIGGRPVVKEYIIRKRIKPNNRQLCVNDMSLLFGGRFACDYEGDTENRKLVNPFIPPHKRHMFGQDADISIKGNCEMNLSQKLWFISHAKDKFPLVIDETNHIHIGLSL